jgi:predicted DNA-binding transcriptional regulator
MRQQRNSQVIINVQNVVCTFYLIIQEINTAVLKIGLICSLQMLMLREVYCLRGLDETELEYALRGKAWKVYWFLLKNGNPVGVREVQRQLHFSSPSIAFHHLEQLRELGLVEKQDVGGNYVLVGQVKIGVLRHYVKLGKLLFPRFFFYALFSTVFYVGYLLLMVQSFTRDNLFIILFGAIVCAVFWYEAYRVWQMRPF